jgi:catechol 2,3-dioxygenase-like lactoylglutathione lyase family enzyme
MGITGDVAGPRPDDASVPESGSVEVASLDHLVLTVADVQRTVEFYRRVLGMTPIAFGGGRRALRFGNSKINLHQLRAEIAPHAAAPTPGSADLCFVTTTPPAKTLERLAACEVPVEEGPVSRAGALGPILSVYFRDPDGNLIELGYYPSASAGPTSPRQEGAA